MTAIRSLCVVLVVCTANPLVAAAQAPPRASGNWSEIQKLPAATELVVSVNGAVAARYTFLFADSSALFVLDEDTLMRAGSRERNLRDILIANASALVSGSRAQFESGDVRVGVDGVFVAARKIADLSDLILRIDRMEVRKVRLARSRRRSSIASATATGAAIGAGVGLALGVSVFRCVPCVESWMAVLVLAGTGIGAAVGASVAAARPARDERVIYSTL